jgi:hypothetical protein
VNDSTGVQLNPIGRDAGLLSSCAGIGVAQEPMVGAGFGPMGRHKPDKARALADRLHQHLGVEIGVVAVVGVGGGTLIALGDPWRAWGIGVVILAVVLALVIFAATLRPTHQERTDQAFKDRAASLADRMDDWLRLALVDDPLPKGAPKEANTSANRAAHRPLLSDVGGRFGKEFGDELRAFRSEPELEQITARRIEWFPSIVGARGCIKSLRRFSELRGPLSRD